MADQSALDAMEAANAILKDRLSTTEEIAAAQEALQNAALDYNLGQMSRTNGMEMGVLGVAGDEDLHSATMDWQSLNSMLEQSVPGFAKITDENERLALALSHTSDEAQRAAIEIQQVLNSNENLNGSARDTGGILNQRDSITQALENTGLSAEESLQLLVTIDDSSYETMTQDIQKVTEQLNDGKPFEVAIQAIMDEQETEDYIKSQLAAYEPEDEDVSKEAFDSLTDTFYENQDQMGVEGTPFADYSEDLFENAEALEDVVESILRYNDAIESLDESYDD
jgi:major membrane immunogen (membrane-anchored lipoprotein)